MSYKPTVPIASGLPPGRNSAMTSDKYFKIQEVNMGPKQIKQMAKQKFQQKIDNREQYHAILKKKAEHDKKKEDAKRIRRMENRQESEEKEIVSPTENTFKNELDAQLKKIEEKSEKDHLVLWEDYERRFAPQAMEEEQSMDQLMLQEDNVWQTDVPPAGLFPTEIFSDPP